MTLIRIFLVAFIFLFCLAGYVTLRPNRVYTYAPLPRGNDSFMFQSHCPLARFFFP